MKREEEKLFLVGYSGSLKKEEKLSPKNRKEDSEQKIQKRKRGRVYWFLSRLSRRRKKKELKKKGEKGEG